MNKLLKKIFVGLLISISANSVFSQSLTLTDCLQKAKEASFKIQASAFRQDAAEQSFLIGKAEALPQFSAEFSYEHRDLQPYGFRQQWSLIHGDWALGNLLLKTSSIYKQNLLAARAETESKQLEVIRRTALLFIEILKMNKQDTLLQNRLRLLQSHYVVAKALWQAGSKTEFDLLQTESEILKLKEKISILKSDQKNVVKELALLLNLNDAENLVLKPVPASEICRKPLPDLTSSLLRRHPVLKALEFRIKAQKMTARLARARQLPGLHLAGGYAVDRDPTGDGNYWSVNAGVSFPLFLWNATKYQTQKAAARARSLEYDKNSTERELSIQIQKIFEKLKQLKHLFVLRNKRLQTTKKAFQLAEADYRAGLVTNLEYLSAQQQLSETQIAIEETQLEYVRDLIEFYIATDQLNKIEELEK